MYMYMYMYVCKGLLYNRDLRKLEMTEYPILMVRRNAILLYLPPFRLIILKVCIFQ